MGCLQRGGTDSYCCIGAKKTEALLSGLLLLHRGRSPGTLLPGHLLLHRETCPEAFLPRHLLMHRAKCSEAPLPGYLLLHREKCPGARLPDNYCNIGESVRKHRSRTGCIGATVRELTLLETRDIHKTRHIFNFQTPQTSITRRRNRVRISP